MKNIIYKFQVLFILTSCERRKNDLENEEQQTIASVPVSKEYSWETSKAGNIW